MLRDVFYYGNKPNAHPREKPAINLEDARQQSTTEHFWVINEYCDYTNFDWDFDFDFLPDEDVWAADHNNIWPSQHQKDSGTWLCSKNDSEILVYRTDVKPVRRKNEKNQNWIIHASIDESKFDFSWHPDPTDPPYIYRWGNEYVPGEYEPTIDYIDNKNASAIKYIHNQVKVLPQWERWKELIPVDKELSILGGFDFTWRPDPREPALIYVFGNQRYDAEVEPTIEYHVPNATIRKYINTTKVHTSLDMSRWKFNYEIEDDFDLSWRPDPCSPPYIYVFGNQHYNAEKMPTVEYHVEGATEYKFIDDIKSTLTSNRNNWKINIPIIESQWDFSWVPDPGSPPYIYVFGNQWHDAEIQSTIEYIVPGATEKKYINDVKAKLLPDMKHWKINYKIDHASFDFSWCPDPGSPPYKYVFGSNLYPATEMACVEYHVEGAVEYKYVDNIVAKLAPDRSNWIIPEDIDANEFKHFDWHPNPNDPPYIYQTGTQWQKTGGPQYIVQGATEVKYIEEFKSKRLSTMTNWIIPKNISTEGFDFSWHPDESSLPYQYVFPTQWSISGGPIYVVPGATEISYCDIQRAKALPCMDNWAYNAKLIDVDSFDWSWQPNVEDQPYIYQFGTQWQKNGGPKYISPGADITSPIKYIDVIKAKRLPNKSDPQWNSLYNIENFDYSWHPDDTDLPYIYVFGNTQYPPEIMPTIEYVVEGATEYKYVHDIAAKLKPTKKNWTIPKNIDASKFDFSWVPNPKDPPYIYVFGTQHQSTGGPKYVVEDATEIKFVGDQKAVALPDKSKWIIPDNVDVSNFDFSWHPDETEPAYKYEFNTQWQKNGGPVYVVKGATEYKYLHTNTVVATPTYKNWEIPPNVKVKSFDYSWHPDNTDEPYIYVFGNNLYPAEVMTTVKYVMPGATQVKFVKDVVATLGTNYDNWIIPDNIDKDSFDFSWVPDPTHPPYIYEFATIWNDRGGPVYKVPGSFSKKYIEDVKAKTLSNKKHWKINIPIVDDGTIFTWAPHPEAPPYIYIFGNQWNSAENESTIEYHVPGATKNKYVSDIIPKVKPNKNKFEILHPIIESEFDFSWRPNPYSPPYIYVFGNQHYSGKVMPTVKYTVEGATEEKFVTDIVAKLDKNMDNWVEVTPINHEQFDYSWVPNPKDPPYIYVWGNKHVPGELKSTIEYHVPGATQRKYMTEPVELEPQWDLWEITQKPTNFDFTWIPDPRDPPYIYVWGNKYIPCEKKPTVTYHMPGATTYKYVSNDIEVEPEWDKWKFLVPVDKTSFDFSWRPDPSEPPFIYVWGNQYNSAEVEPTIEYHAPGAGSERKYMHDCVVKTLPMSEKWKILIPIKDFDFTWRPEPGSPPYIYVFGNQWHSGEVEPTLEYHEIGATDRKYINNIIAEVAIDMTNWIVPEGINVDDFDFSWRPNPGSPPYIYQFGTLLDDNDGPRYVHPDNTGDIVRLERVRKDGQDLTLEDSMEKAVVKKYYIKTTLEDLADEHPNEIFWALNPDIDYTNFDFTWRPTIEQARYIHAFGAADNISTQTYFVSGKMWKQGNRSINYVEKKVDLKFLVDLFFVDRGNAESQQRFNNLKEIFGNRIQKTRYLNSWVDTITRCINRANTNLCWILNSELDYTNFNFDYYPNPWQMKMIHVFGTQWSHWGTTFMIKRDTFLENTKFIKIIEHLNNLNFVKGRIAKATNCLYDVYLIDHGNDFDDIKNQLENKTKKSVTVVPYKESYLKTFKNMLQNLETKKEHYIWICSSVCDYTSFDFSYICDPFAKENLHVFPSNNQKFGDTFLVDVNRLRILIDELKNLEDYQKVNYNQHQRAKRLDPPVFVVDEDTHFNSCDKEYNFPYALFYTKDNENLTYTYKEPMSLWATHTKNIEILSTGGSLLALPKQVKEHIHDQLYDYPYISEAKNLVKSNPLDIVYLSNGEKTADENYEHLLKITKGLPNRVVRVDGINGRVAAYHAAAQASNTPWMFTIFAKLKVDKNFDWNWQPDRLQIPKHYIFNARNPLNGLIYGHQAIIAYNKKLALKNSGKGLDFTLDDPHESVDMLSGIANFNTDPYSTWRTAFREVIKLKSDTSDISYDRLQVWLSTAEGNFAEDCLRGAQDAIDYYNEVSGDITQLKYSYEWRWLQDYYKRKYK